MLERPPLTALAACILLATQCANPTTATAPRTTTTAVQADTTAAQTPPAPTDPTDIAPPAAGHLRIGTWNLEHFGSRTPRRVERDFERIAKWIRKIGVDLLAVQEINGRAPMRALVQQLGPSYRFTLGTTGEFDRTFISVGFVWNRERVELVQCEEMTDFPSKVGDLHVFHRKPVNAVFRARLGDGGGFDFRAITVHLKASRGRSNERKRRAEVKILREYLAGLAARPGEDRDVIVLGDFNHGVTAPAHGEFCKDGVVEYLVRKPTPAPTIVWFDEPIDQIALCAGAREEVVGSTFTVHNQLIDFTAPRSRIEVAKAGWRALYSDHFPVTVDFAAARDGDPEATFAPAVRTLRDEGATAEGGAAERR